MDFLPMFGVPPSERAKPLSLEVIREVLAAHLPRIMETPCYRPGDELVQPPGAKMYSIGTPECPAVFVRYLTTDEIEIQECNGLVDCLIAGVNGPTVGVWPAASWRFVLFTGEEPERALQKLSEFCSQNYGFVPLAEVRELFPSDAEATRWFLMHGWSREFRRVPHKKTPEVVFEDQNREEGKLTPRVRVTIIDGVVEQVEVEGRDAEPTP